MDVTEDRTREMEMAVDDSGGVGGAARYLRGSGRSVARGIGEEGEESGRGGWRGGGCVEGEEMDGGLCGGGVGVVVVIG